MSNRHCLYAAELADGACGELDQFEQVDRLAGHLCDWVHEAAMDTSYRFTQDQKDWICRMMARAMLDQHEYEQEIWGEAIVNLKDYKPLPEHPDIKST